MTAQAAPHRIGLIVLSGISPERLTGSGNTPLNRATLRARGELDPSPNFRLYSFQAK